MSYLLLANSSSVSWYLKVTVVIDCGSEESMGSVVATLPRFGVASKAMVHCTMSSATQVYLPTITLLDDEHGVRTWWPRGYGSQPLYDLTVGQYVLSWCSKIVDSCIRNSNIYNEIWLFDVLSSIQLIQLRLSIQNLKP